LANEAAALDPGFAGFWIINKKRQPEPGGTRNHQQMFLIVAI
jgi:hypothetical protein